MKQIVLKTRVWGLVVVAMATSGVLTACFTNVQSQPQAQNGIPNASDQYSMNHGDMKPTGMVNHRMINLGPADAEFDLRFIDSMIPHHEGALSMAAEALQKSRRSELKKLAQDIIKAQEKEIKQMKQWRKAWYPKAPSTPVAWHAQGHSMAMSEDQIKAMRMNVDLGTADDKFDQRFITAMILHHEGAIVMAKDALQKSKRTEILQLAKAIIASQQAEIDQMKQWSSSL